MLRSTNEVVCNDAYLPSGWLRPWCVDGEHVWYYISSCFHFEEKQKSAHSGAGCGNASAVGVSALRYRLFRPRRRCPQSSVREKRFREAKLGCLYYRVCSYDVRQRAACSSGDDAWAVLRFLSPPRGMRTVFLGSSRRSFSLNNLHTAAFS